jgi:lipid-binding SYLF domain-containing protein
VYENVYLGFTAVAFASSTFAVEKVELDNRIRTLTAKFEELQSKPDKCVPADNLRKAQGIILLERTKAGLVFGYHGGGGVAMVRDPKSEKWSAAAFLSAHEGSFGAQIGGERTFFAILLMSTNATHLLVESKFDFGGEARGTAGDSTAVKEGKSTRRNRPCFYDSHKGFYGVLHQRRFGFSRRRGQSRLLPAVLTTKEILFENKVKATKPQQLWRTN